MSDKKKPKHGRPWDINARFDTFKEADDRRKDLLERSDNKHDVKVKRFCVDIGKWAFLVKTRLKKEFWNKDRASEKGLHRKNSKSKKRSKKGLPRTG